jgi:DNA processing protein
VSQQVVRSVLRVMVCSPCLRRSAVLAAAAPALALARFASRPRLLLSVMALPSERLLRAARVEDPPGVLRGLQLPVLTDRVPTALCRHDPGYPRALRELPSAPSVLYATCTPRRLRELLSPADPKVAIRRRSRATRPIRSCSTRE